MRRLLTVVLLAALLAPGGALAQDPQVPARRVDIKTQRRDRHLPIEQWPGSFPLPGLPTRMRIGGFIELDALFDTGPMGNPGDRTGWPDGTLAVSWDHPDVRLMGAVLARDLRASVGDGPSRTTLGWGGSLSGQVTVDVGKLQDSAVFSVSYGRGIGSDFNDAPTDAVLDADGLHALPAFGWLVGYQHSWSPQLSSTVSYGVLDVGSQDVQPPGSLQKTTYASANLVWTPDSHWTIGVEGLWGTLHNNDGTTGTDYRTQVTTRFSF